MLRSFVSIAFLYASVTLAASAASSTNPQLRTICGSEHRSAKADTAEQHFASHKTKLLSSKKKAANSIAVYWHVIRQNDTLPGGNVNDSQISDQIQVLNDAYNPSGIHFVHAETTRTTNATWFDNATIDALGIETVSQTDMKRALRRGGASSLNIYSAGLTSSYLLGYSTFPFDYDNNPTNDGVVIHYATLPGGTATSFNLGHIAVHEVGHWVGLYHTFQGGCDGPGDFVDDTSPERGPAFGCPSGLQSCDGGDVDPIHNFMDYTDDACRSEFTPGQGQRMRDQLALYRGVEDKVDRNT